MISFILIFAHILFMSMFQNVRVRGSRWSSDIDPNRLQESSRFHTTPGSASDSAATPSTELSGNLSKSIWYAIALKNLLSHLHHDSQTTWWSHPAATHPSSDRNADKNLTSRNLPDPHEITNPDDVNHPLDSQYGNAEELVARGNCIPKSILECDECNYVTHLRSGMSRHLRLAHDKAMNKIVIYIYLYLFISTSTYCT